MKNILFVILFVATSWVAWAATGKPWPHCGPKKIPYNPDKKGCCGNKITPYPENANPCARSDVQALCKKEGGIPFVEKACRNYGITICYNGQKYACVCNCMKITNPDLLACIQAHENMHSASKYWKCPNCSISVPNDNSDAATREHCEQYRKDLECAKAVQPYPGEKENVLKDYLENLNAKIRECERNRM